MADMSLPLHEIRRQFPILERRCGPHPLAYLDSAATAQKPECILRAMDTFLRTANANAHRGMHLLAEEATEHYECARRTIQRFLNARYAEEIVFVKSCTEAINLVANALSYKTIALSLLEHHSNVIPWMQRGARIHWIDIHDNGALRYEDLDRTLQHNTCDVVAITGQSNVIGLQPDLPRIIKTAHAAGARILIDAAQLVAHRPIDVQALDCDFLAFSGHKLFGPTGIGVLYAKRELLEHMPPLLGGGGMVQTVNETSFVPLEPPARFEAGTPPVAEALGLAAAIDWLSQFSWDDIIAHEQQLLARATEILSSIPNLTILGKLPAVRQPLAAHAGCLSFTINSIHPHDLTDLLSSEGFCLRAGHHCAQPLHKRFGIAASTRLSIALYNTIEEIDRLPAAIERARRLLLGKRHATNYKLQTTH